MRGNLWVDCFLLLLLFGLNCRFSSFLQKLSIFLLDDNPRISFKPQIFVRPDNHPLNNILLQPGKLQHGRNSGIHNRIHAKNLIEGSLAVHRDMSDVVLQQFGDIEDIGPVIHLTCYDKDVESEEFVVGGVVYSLLNCFCAFHVVGIFLGPVASEVLSVNCEFEHLGLELLDCVVDVGQFIVESCHKIPRIKERFLEKFSRVLAGDRNFLGQKISPPPVTGSLPIEMNGKVRPMYLLRCHPQNIFAIVALLPHVLDKFIPGCQLQRGVLMEFELL